MKTNLLPYLKMISFGFLRNSIGMSMILFLGLFLGSCGDPSEISDELLDGKVIFDPSLLNPESYLTSLRHPNPTAEEASRPVFILCHGYSASTFEWSEFIDWSEDTDAYFTSRVLLGGHGRSYSDFKSAKWEDWQQAIFDEYEALLDAGYTNLHLVGSSTGGALILEAIAAGYFRDKIPPKSVFMVDPIVLPSDKILPLIGVLGPLVGYTESENTEGEKNYWYTFRPYKTLQELQEVIKKVRLDLQKGIELPAGTYLTVYKSTQDPSADPASAVLIYQGVSPKSQMNIHMVNSSLHVFTRLKYREDPVSAQDWLNQEQTFEEMVEIALSR
ncbi:alpha/beta fold hydrolase [Algoriphagus sp. CAU 1675]|uniref:alpha/beta hydrolase n=1 Tax=Algoriphagus sp. CAU 1675 TaxID=3032597 RepID=UPI0023D9C0B4|nr:alpha/beta fold hydrolase [Algoriphagus sp. CAU 1675]MDF2157784.1 alpha/beta fold hydrolase [Algoriphagus sp. CAU 1675]